MFVFNTLQVNVKYPLNNLRGLVLKRTIRERLVVPVTERGDRTRAFRVVWRYDDDHLVHAWNQIVSRRKVCDQVVAQTPSLQMFVSCISGVFNKGGGSEGQVKPVYPAVSYWAVFDGAGADSSGEMGQRLMATFPSAQVKAITSVLHRQSEEPMAANCQMLFVVLKDHRSGFVSQKICRSLFASGASDVPSNHRNAKLAVMSTSRFQQQQTASIEALQVAGLCIDLEVLEADSVAPTVPN